MPAAPTAHAANGSRGVNGAQLPQFPGGEAEQPMFEQGIWACGGTPLPPQLWQPGGGGFGQGGVLDGMPPGPELGLLLPGAGDVSGLDDGELTGVVRGWRRMGSWAAAMEHAAVAELARRRAAEAESCGARSEEVARYAAAEVAAALTLTSCSADGLMGRALSLATLPGTWAALAAGRIDVPKVLVVLNGVSCLGADLARAVEAQVVAAAGGQTTGELRKAVAAAVVAAGPAAAGARVAEAVKSARVERWAEPSGTAAMAGRDLPVAEVLAAGNRVSALAAALKAGGAPGGIGLLRAQVFLGLLLGRPVAAPADETAPGGAGFADGTEADTATATAPGTALSAATGAAACTAHDTPPGGAGFADGTEADTATATAPGTAVGAATAPETAITGPAAGAAAGPAPGAAPGAAPRAVTGPAAGPAVGPAVGPAAGLAVGPAAEATGPAHAAGAAGGGTVAGGAVAGGADVSCDAAVAGGTVAAGLAGVGPPADAGCAQRPVAAGAGSEPAGPVSELKRVPAGMAGVAAGEVVGVAAGVPRVPAGVAQVAEVARVAGQPVAKGWPGMAGSVNLTVPLRALLGLPSQPAEAAGFGPLSPAVTRELLTAAQHSSAVRWCVTVTDGQGRAAGHGCAARQPAGPGGWALTVTIRGLETGGCSHARESAAYKPPPLLRHLIQTRHKTCTFPGCGRPAWQCDADHTLAYDDGGRTCECNLAPLCRKHHKVKQAEGWRLEQPSPGVLQWVTPSGWRYTINPSIYPA